MAPTAAIRSLPPLCIFHLYLWSSAVVTAVDDGEEPAALAEFGPRQVQFHRLTASWRRSLGRFCLDADSGASSGRSPNCCRSRVDLSKTNCVKQVRYRQGHDDPALAGDAVPLLQDTQWMSEPG